MMSVRRFTGSTLVVATHNTNKLVEIRSILDGRVIKIVSAKDLNLPEPEETGTSFAENAALKALAAAVASGLPSLADDSGLAVAALNGAPGIHSARWAGDERDFMAAMSQVHERIGNNPDRSAAFVCAMALAFPDGHVELAEGRVDGEIVWPPRGSGGFGYDPIFQPVGRTHTFGEMTPEEKRAISHRARALAAMLERCFP
ncbi:MAG: RdgB/HAM1 family non-canonical purine NTP pyrophosphatase [Pseudomonadota bacterium]|nr:RdgB/HAM1 family non-canonical purine NTP pyrophosphatase [Pseudomonadota bacterium]